MKKLQKILVVCMVFTLITAMAGCGEKASKYEGTWELNKVKTEIPENRQALREPGRFLECFLA